MRISFILFLLSIAVSSIPSSVEAMKRSLTHRDFTAPALVEPADAIESYDALRGSIVKLRRMISQNFAAWHDESCLDAEQLGVFFKALVSLFKLFHNCDKKALAHDHHFTGLWGLLNLEIFLLAQRLRDCSFGAWGQKLAGELDAIKGGRYLNEVKFYPEQCAPPSPSSAEEDADRRILHWCTLWDGTMRTNKASSCLITHVPRKVGPLASISEDCKGEGVESKESDEE